MGSLSNMMERTRSIQGFAPELREGGGQDQIFKMNMLQSWSWGARNFLRNDKIFIKG